MDGVNEPRGAVRPLTVCLVEAHAVARELLVDVLEQAGHLVLAAVGTHPDGLAVILEHLPEVAIIDHRSPRASGISLCRAITSKAPAVRTVLHATVVEPDLEEQALRAGAAAIVAKSIDASLLLGAISAHRR